MNITMKPTITVSLLVFCVTNVCAQYHQRPATSNIKIYTNTEDVQSRLNATLDGAQRDVYRNRDPALAKAVAKMLILRGDRLKTSESRPKASTTDTYADRVKADRSGYNSNGDNGEYNNGYENIDNNGFTGATAVGNGGGGSDYASTGRAYGALTQVFAAPTPMAYPAAALAAPTPVVFAEQVSLGKLKTSEKLKTHSGQQYVPPPPPPPIQRVVEQVPVEVPVPVPIIRQVPQPIPVDRFVPVDRPVPVVHQVAEPVPVPIPIIRHVPVPHPVPMIQRVVQHVDRPVFIDRAVPIAQPIPVPIVRNIVAMPAMPVYNNRMVGVTYRSVVRGTNNSSSGPKVRVESRSFPMFSGFSAFGRFNRLMSGFRGSRPFAAVNVGGGGGGYKR